MVASDVQKMVAPEGEELSDAIGLVLKDHTGPVDLASVAEKLKEDHPTWKLPDRRVKKFVKKYESEHKATEGEEAPTTKSRPKMFSSPRKSIRNLFSSKSKKKATEELDTDSSVQPAEEAPVAEEEPVVEAPDDEKAEETPEEIAYKTEVESVESSNDCFVLCTIM
eukprot:CAMPEP_0116138680 /NCGR_PEP_ID=MMETSP0329-20121206/12907_1 /TAXON_ID=697910 /ORGANISM="Pseudo-nitzschia arenysensis, Strain B593" /LENGTH=165 /DNA_ID=CAMNT_0003633671 /DNA_START=203 /DNA_END=700 /DNA_ORIENTATION=+